MNIKYAWETIEQSLTFIGEHLTEDIYTEELANMAGLSPFYFQRLFKRQVNKPVQEYVKFRRLAKVIEFDSRIRSAVSVTKIFSRQANADHGQITLGIS